MTTRLCSLCKTPGHNIKRCNDKSIETTFKETLRKVDLCLGNQLSNEDLESAKTYLRDIPQPLLYTLGCQIGKTQIKDSTETHIDQICVAIQKIAVDVSNMSRHDRKWFLQWVDPTWRDEDDENEEIDIVVEETINPFEQETVLSFHPIIQPFILCVDDLNEMTECAICYEEKKVFEFDKANCGHEFCHECICKHIDSKICQTTCPLCRTFIHSLEVKDAENYREIKREYNEISSILKDCYQMLFDNSYLPYETFDERINNLLQQLNNEELTASVNDEIVSDLDKAGLIWRFIYYS